MPLFFGWEGGVRTHEMTESKSVALPLGDFPSLHLPCLLYWALLWCTCQLSWCWAKGLSPLGAMAGFVFATTSSGLFSLYSLATNILIIYIAFSYLCTFKRFSLWTKPSGLEPKPSDPLWVGMLSAYTKLLISATLNSTIVQMVINEPRCLTV